MADSLNVYLRSLKPILADAEHGSCGPSQKGARVDGRRAGPVPNRV